MDISQKEISNLLTLVAACDIQRKEIERIYESSGIRYNIFDVLKLSSSEVRLHSSIIASLLRTNNHGAKDAFLKEFLRIPSLKLPHDYFDLQRVSVEVEKNIGPLTEDRGGRIDIFLNDGTKSIIIENKIYAYDQKNQLLRYHNFEPDGILIYLTLFDGTQPSDDSLNGLDKDDYICLSYECDIIPWLERCVNLASNLPYVRETINQYINTLKQLTNSNMITNEDIIDILIQRENLSAAFAIRDNLDASVNKLMNAFFKQLKEEFSTSSPFRCVQEAPKNWLDRYTNIEFEHCDWHNFKFAISFQGKCLSDVIIGFLKKANCDAIEKEAGAIKLAKSLGYDKHSDWWLYGYPNETRLSNWYNAETLQMLRDGTMIEWFKNTLDFVDKTSRGMRL